MKGSEIQNLVFSLSLFGYKRSDIKAFLREISEYVLNLETKIYKLEKERDELKNDIKEDTKNQIKFKDIMVSAQDYKEKTKKETNVIAKEIIGKAKKEYEKIMDIKKKEETKFKKVIRDLHILSKNLYDNLQNYANIMESKEKNMFIHERPLYENIENEKMEKEKEEYDLKKMIRIPEEENDKENATIEFNTNIDDKAELEEETKKYRRNKMNEDDSDSYIKAKFKEIDLR